MCAVHGRILIATTNHVEQLDPALIRPGRLDLQMELGYVDIEIFDQFLKRFFGKGIHENKAKLKEGLTCAELQSLLLQKKAFDEIVRYATCD